MPTKVNWATRIFITCKHFDGLITGLATVFLVIVTGVLAYIAYRTDETNRITSRPYIAATGLTIDTQRLPMMWNFSIIFENSGGTPPVGMKYVIRSSIQQPEDPDDFFTNPQKLDYVGFGTVAPKSKSSIEFVSGVPVKFFEDRKRWYISGAIHYRDHFDQKINHVSKFCFAAIGAKDYRTNGIRPAYDVCRFWNCIDEQDCKADRQRYDIEMTKLTSLNGRSQR